MARELALTIVVWMAILLGLGGGVWLYFFMRFPMPALRKVRSLWLRGQHTESHELVCKLIPRIEERRDYRNLATARLWMAAYAWENELTKVMAEQSRRAVDEAIAMGKPWQQLWADIAYGLALVAIGRFEDARKPLENAELMTTTMNAPRPRMFIRTGLGWSHWVTGNRAMATDYAKAAGADVGRYPELAYQHPRLLLELGHLCFELGLWDEALLRLDETQAHAPEGSLIRTRALLFHARIDLERGEFDRAVEILEKGLRGLPQDSSELRGWHHFYLSRIHHLAAQPQPARLSLEQARMEAARADVPDLSCMVGLALTRQLRSQKQHTQAREILLRIQVELLSEEPGPLLAQTLLAWGEWFLDQGDDREAFAHFRLADRLLSGLDQATIDPDLPYRLALLHHRMGLLPEGIRYEQEGDALRRRLGIRRPAPIRRGVIQAA